MMYSTVKEMMPYAHIFLLSSINNFWTSRPIFMEVGCAFGGSPSAIRFKLSVEYTH